MKHASLLLTAAAMMSTAGYCAASIDQIIDEPTMLERAQQAIALPENSPYAYSIDLNLLADSGDQNIQIHRPYSENTAIEAGIAMHKTDLRHINVGARFIASGLKTDTFIPYAGLGASYLAGGKNWQEQFTAYMSVGVQFKINNTVSLNTRLNMFPVHSDELNNISSGFSFTF